MADIVGVAKDMAVEIDAVVMHAVALLAALLAQAFARVAPIAVMMAATGRNWSGLRFSKGAAAKERGQSSKSPPAIDQPIADS